MKDLNKNKIYIIVAVICVLLLIFVLIFSIHKHSKQSLVIKGEIEYTEITTGYIVKKEATVQKDGSKVLVPVVAEGAKIAKENIIATYKGEEYKNYEETLANMDNDILQRMQDLPAVYSSEVDAIDEEIYDLVKQSMEENSYNKMQEYKQKINNNINKRASIIGELSPDGAEIKELISKRNEYEKAAKESNDNILAPISGIVVYNADGLEEKLTIKNIDNLDYNNIKRLVDTESDVDNTKIKVVNNYEAYIVIKSDLENVEYMGEGYDYRLRLIEENNYELLVTLERKVETEDGVEVYFKITNGLENIVSLREAEVEIVWDHASGYLVPNEALNKYENKQAYYVSVIRYVEFETIAVDVKIQNEGYSIVKNYTDEKLEELGINSQLPLKLYDRLVIESKK